MSVPKRHARYDKTGYKNLIFAMKAILFGNRSRYMTKRRYAEFFDNDEDFDLE